MRTIWKSISFQKEKGSRGAAGMPESCSLIFDKSEFYSNTAGWHAVFSGALPVCACAAAVEA
jgi:hypothetical protein